MFVRYDVSASKCLGKYRLFCLMLNKKYSIFNAGSSPSIDGIFFHSVCLLIALIPYAICDSAAQRSFDKIISKQGYRVEVELTQIEKR